MRAVEWIAALVGATICILGAIVTAENQLEPFGLSQSPAQILWPLPGLVLLDWAALGLLGLVSVALSNIHQAWTWSKFTWAICGALVVLMILGAFSIGPYVMWAMLCYCWRARVDPSEASSRCRPAGAHARGIWQFVAASYLHSLGEALKNGPILAGGLVYMMNQICRGTRHRVI